MRIRSWSEFTGSDRAAVAIALLAAVSLIVLPLLIGPGGWVAVPILVLLVDLTYLRMRMAVLRGAGRRP